MLSLITFGLLAVASAASQQPVARKCMNMTVPVTISGRNAVFNVSVPSTNSEVTAFVLNSTRPGANITNDFLTGYKTVSGTYNISTQFCQPANSTARNPVVQVLTHGVGFDRTYWDLSFDNYNYSYVNSALAAGYYTMSYDRLGIANSSHGEPVNEIQAGLEVQALRALTQKLRNGTFPGVNHTFGNNIVHVGHSFGSAQTYAFSALYPNETSGIVLTGFSVNSSYVSSFLMGGNFQLANTNQPLRLGNVDRAAVQAFVNLSPFADFLTPIDPTSLPPSYNYPNGYIVTGNREATEALFFQPGSFDPAILTVAEQTKQPATYGELLTQNSAPMMSPFTGPVLVLTGQYDLPFCGGNCYATGGAMPNIPAGVSMAYATNKAANFSSYIQPGAAHGLNFHYNATGGYQVIQNYFASKGLKST